MNSDRAPRVLVIGDVVLDRYWHGTSERISREAPVPVVRVSRTEERPGGAANVAANIVSIGGHATLSSVVGADDAGTALKRLMRDAGIEEKLDVDPARQTIVKLRVVGRGQHMARIDFEEDIPRPSQPEELLRARARIPGHEAIVLSDYGGGVLASPQCLLQDAASRGVPVLIDPRGADYARYRGAAVLTPNIGELRHVVGQWLSEQDLLERVQRLRTELQIQAVVLTRGEAGLSVYDADGGVHIPAETREVFDVTGAGDTVIAALAMGMATGQPLVDAARYANRAAGIVVGKFGTSTVSRAEMLTLAP